MTDHPFRPSKQHYDYVDDETGHAIKERLSPITHGTSEIDMTKLLRPSPRKTKNIDLLIIEASLVEDGTELDNPATPATDKVAKQALEKLEQKELTPAWR